MYSTTSFSSVMVLRTPWIPDIMYISTLPDLPLCPLLSCLVLRRHARHSPRQPAVRSQLATDPPNRSCVDHPCLTLELHRQDCAMGDSTRSSRKE